MPNKDPLPTRPDIPPNPILDPQQPPKPTPQDNPSDTPRPGPDPKQPRDFAVFSIDEHLLKKIYLDFF